MPKCAIAVVLVACLGVPAMSQTRLWSVEFGSSEYDSPTDLLSDGQGGVLVAGVTEGAFAGGPAGAEWLVRYGADGDEMWRTTVQGPGAWKPLHWRVPTLAPDGFGGVVVACRDDFDDEPFTARYALDGSHLGSRSERAGLRGVTGLGGGCYFLIGRNELPDVWVSRHEDDGQETWISHLMAPGEQETTGWAWCADGQAGVVVGGLTYEHLATPVIGENDAWTWRVSVMGGFQWLNQTSSPDWEVITSIEPTSGGFFQAGFLGLETTAWIERLELDGQLAWRTELDQQQNRESALDVLALPDGGALAVGWWTPGVPPTWSDQFRTWLVRVDAAGKVLWRREFEFADAASGLRLQPDDAGGAFVTGWVGSELGGPQLWAETDAFLARYSLCLPDLTTSALIWHPNYGVPDGVVSTDDFFYYLSQFAAGNTALCDLTHGAVLGEPDYGTPDGVLSNDDFFYYLAFYARGC